MQAAASETPPSFLRAFLPVFILLFIVVCIAGAFLYPPSFHYLSKLFIQVYTMGNEGLFIFFLAYPISMAIGFPVTVLDIVVGFLYPWEMGFVVAYSGKAVGCAFCYCIAGIVLKGTFQAWARHKPFLRKVRILMRRYPWKYCFLLRIVYIPATIKNYGLAALQVPFVPYFVSSLTLTFFTSMWQVTLGREGKTLVQAIDMELSSEQIGFLMFAGGVSMTAILVLVLYTRKVINDIDDLEDLQEASPRHTNSEGPVSA